MLVAEGGGSFFGFVAGWIEQTHNIAETPDSNRFGYISDIYVAPTVTWLRINSLAVDTSARSSYEHAGFIPYEVVYEKALATDSAE